MRMSDWSSDVCSSALPRHRARPGGPRPLEPGMLVGGVVDDQLGDHPEAAAVRLLHEAPEVPHGAVGGVDLAVVGDVVAVVRSEEHTSELQSLMRISYAVFCLKKKTSKNNY